MPGGSPWFGFGVVALGGGWPADGGGRAGFGLPGRPASGWPWVERLAVLQERLGWMELWSCSIRTGPCPDGAGVGPRPAILLPVGFCTGLPVQVEAIPP